MIPPGPCSWLPLRYLDAAGTVSTWGSPAYGVLVFFYKKTTEMPCEQWTNPGCLRVYRGWNILPSYMGIVILAWNKDPYLNNRYNGRSKLGGCFPKKCVMKFEEMAFGQGIFFEEIQTHTISYFGRKNMLKILLDNILHQLIQVQVSKYGEHPKWIAVSQWIQVKKRSVLFHLFEDLSQKIIHVMLVFAFFLPNLYLFISSVHLFKPQTKHSEHLIKQPPWN